MPNKIVIKSLPKSWWAIYTEALLNSRGQKTEAQEWQERMRRDSELMRAMEAVSWGNWVQQQRAKGAE